MTPDAPTPETNTEELTAEQLDQVAAGATNGNLQIMQLTSVAERSSPTGRITSLAVDP